MARVQAAEKPTETVAASNLKCAECGASDVSKARKFPAGQRVGPTVVCPYCAAISVMEGGKTRMLRTHEWVPVVLEPFGFELLEHRLATARKLGLA